MFINLEQVSKVKEFVSISQGCTSEVTLNSGKYSVDAKSILGIFSLDLCKPIELVCDDEADYAKFGQFKA
jgi:phosphotransferase system HPr-like phosphotransfer protein